MCYKAILYGSHLDVAQRMLDFDYICGNEPSVVAIFSQKKTLYKLFRGTHEIIIPSLTSRDQCKQYSPNVLINLASSRSATQVVRDALILDLFEYIVVVAEGIPERETRSLIAYAKWFSCKLMGPSTVGGIIAGTFRIANTGGSIENMLKSKLFCSWSIGFVSKSGGMSNEMYRIIANNTDGLHTWFCIWWDRYPYSTFADIVIEYENNPEIKMIVMLWEVGDPSELVVADMVKSWKITKPIVAWVSWTSADNNFQDIQFWHAGAKANADNEKASPKNTYLKQCGVFVPQSFDSIGDLMRTTFEQISGKSVELLNMQYNDKVFPKLKSLYTWLRNRRKTSFTSTISDERWDELLYNKIPISQFVSQWSIAAVIGHLWFKRQLPDYALEFLTTVLILTADHGPAVSGAVNTIVTARAGKDIVSSLIAGLSTIWPRFGWAIQDAAQTRYDYKQQAKTAEQCVYDFKMLWRPIPGIWHKVKSQYNPDKRCMILFDLSKKMPSSSYLEFALWVERITLQKKQNLILNVDWYIAAMMLDVMDSLDFDADMINMYISSWMLNGLFALSRSIWLIGHAIDQHCLSESLYRVSRDDIAYL